MFKLIFEFYFSEKFKLKVRDSNLARFEFAESAVYRLPISFLGFGLRASPFTEYMVCTSRDLVVHNLLTSLVWFVL